MIFVSDSITNDHNSYHFYDDYFYQSLFIFITF